METYQTLNKSLKSFHLHAVIYRHLIYWQLTINCDRWPTNNDKSEESQTVLPCMHSLFIYIVNCSPVLYFPLWRLKDILSLKRTWNITTTDTCCTESLQMHVTAQMSHCTLQGCSNEKTGFGTDRSFQIPQNTFVLFCFGLVFTVDISQMQSTSFQIENR